jgi:NAD+ kinase
MNTLIVFQKGYCEKFLFELEAVLKEHNSQYICVERDILKESDYSDKSLVVVIGGDGTFLKASHLNKQIPQFGINPDTSRKEGFYMRSDFNNFKEKLNKLLKGKYKHAELLRLKVEINGIQLKGTALNEVYIGDSKPYNVFNYKLLISDKKEFQRSSGVIVGTPSGSNAWLKSAGGKVLDLEARSFQYLIREPYQGKLANGFKLLKGVIAAPDKLEIMPKSPGIVVIDSFTKEYKVKQGDKVTISAGEFLKYVIC